jgi:hypothetical protein
VKGLPVADTHAAFHLLEMGAARLFLSLAILLPFAASAAENLPATMQPPPPRPQAEAGDKAPETSPPADEAAEDLPAAMTPPQPRPQKQAAGEAPGTTSLPSDEASCRQRLRALGVAFEEAPPIAEPQGCMAPHPVTVSRLSATVALQPPAVLTCAMAEASARFVRGHAAPLAERTFASKLATLEQASAFVCRPRHGTRKLSEHAFANALDWSALVLADGTRIEVRAHDEKKEPREFALLSGIRKAACGPFSTVLGPGSDADHADQFHFDLATRRNPFCQ